MKIKKNKIFKPFICAILLFALIVNATGCAGRTESKTTSQSQTEASPAPQGGKTVHLKSKNLMEGIKANAARGKAADDEFIKSSADFAVKLFQKSLSEEGNTLISPLSVMLALAMTANGAEGETKAQAEAVLGGGMPIEKLNEYLYAYVKKLPSGEKAKLSIANSIWFRNNGGFEAEPEFLQTNADYYNASAYASPFDKKTVNDINSWVKTHTDGMIEKIIEGDSIDPLTVMYLINAVAFDARWQEIYEESDIRDGIFHSLNGAEKKVEMMWSREGRYIEDGSAVGFIKPYENGYSFAALLPNEGTAINDYIAGMTGEKFINAIKNAQFGTVKAAIPKFGYEYEAVMNDMLAKLGMPIAFDPEKADFSKLGHSPIGNLYIGKVLHKTFIRLDEAGTKAGAVTSVEEKCEGALAPEKPLSVILDRPFVYAIIDNATGLPIFIGAATDIGK